MVATKQDAEIIRDKEHTSTHPAPARPRVPGNKQMSLMLLSSAFLWIKGDHICSYLSEDPFSLGEVSCGLQKSTSSDELANWKQHKDVLK